MLFWGQRMYTASYADRVFICGSTDAIDVQKDAGVQETVQDTA